MANEKTLTVSNEPACYTCYTNNSIHEITGENCLFEIITYDDSVLLSIDPIDLKDWSFSDISLKLKHFEIMKRLGIYILEKAGWTINDRDK